MPNICPDREFDSLPRGVRDLLNETGVPLPQFRMIEKSLGTSNAIHYFLSPDYLARRYIFAGMEEMAQYSVEREISIALRNKRFNRLPKVRFSDRS